MSCTCGGVAIIDGTSPILDVHSIIQDWAWNHYMKRVGRFRKLFLHREDFDIDVPMNFYAFEDSSTKFDDASPDPTEKFKPPTPPQSDSNPSADSTERVKAKKNMSKTDVIHPNTSILSTKYVNDTNMDQVYKFRMERARKAIVTVTFQKGFSIGGRAKFTLGVADGEVTTNLSVTKTTGETFEQTLTFETNSDINVERNSKCTARVFFSEKEIRKKFTVKTTMSLPHRSAPIFIRRKKDQKLFALLQLTDLAYVFDPLRERQEVEYIEERFPIDELEPNKGNYITHNVQFTTKGIVEGMRLSGQTVRLQTVDLIKGQKLSTLNEDLTEHENDHYGVGENSDLANQENRQSDTSQNSDSGDQKNRRNGVGAKPKVRI